MQAARQSATVLLLHGLWMGGWAMVWLARSLRQAGFVTAAVPYPSMRGTPAAHVRRLAAAVSACDTENVHLVGHSMGGVIVLRYIQGGAHGRVGRALLLGTPALGCRAALAFERQPWGPVMLANSLPLWRSPFPEAVDAAVEVGAIAGSEPFGLGPLFVRLPAPSDGVVMVEETQIRGLRDHIVMPVSHTGMLMSAQVARQAVSFLKKGQFVR
jgi:pimeloyl-ACP methyl ester carboxylesterase